MIKKKKNLSIFSSFNNTTPIFVIFFPFYRYYFRQVEKCPLHNLATLVSYLMRNH